MERMSAGGLEPDQRFVDHRILPAFGDEADLAADRGGSQREGGERRESAGEEGEGSSHSA